MYSAMTRNGNFDETSPLLLRQTTKNETETEYNRLSPPRQRMDSSNTGHVTHETFKNLDDVGFYGAYAHIRQKLDYTYHRHYKKERQWLHDSIIEDYLFHSSPSHPFYVPCEPWIILTVGVQGSGKRYTIDKLVESNRLRLLSFVYVDTGKLRGTTEKLQLPMNSLL